MAQILEFKIDQSVLELNQKKAEVRAKCEATCTPDFLAKYNQMHPLAKVIELYPREEE